MTAPETGKTRESRATVPVERSLEKRLLAYAAAAGASLVSVQAASAKVIYTPINLTIETGTVPLDLNHDGVVDFNVVERAGTQNFYPEYFRSLKINGAGHSGAGVLATSYHYFPPVVRARPLPSGMLIGPGEHFGRVQNANASMADLYASIGIDTYLRCYGWFAGFPFCSGTADTFLGLRFVVSGKTYYGWAGFSVIKVGFNRYRPYIHARLVGAAYEDVPGRPIRAGQLHDGTATIETAPDPQPATLGLLALGAPGLNIWRRREAT